MPGWNWRGASSMEKCSNLTTNQSLCIAAFLACTHWPHTQKWVVPTKSADRMCSFLSMHFHTQEIYYAEEIKSVPKLSTTGSKSIIELFLQWKKFHFLFSFISITPLRNSIPDIILFTSHLLLQEPMLTYGRKGMATFQVYKAETQSPPIQMKICPTSFFKEIPQHSHNPE